MMHNHRLMLVLLSVFVFFSSVLAAFSQNTEEEESILKQFPRSKYTYRFSQMTKREYYRFPYNIPLFDPLDLKYFPHESWNQTDWGLLSRYEDGNTFKQLIMLREPAETWVFNGNAIGQEYGLLDDFYLYATLFISDSYPDDAGSCYVYYSDSLFKGFGLNTGILIDPEEGIFQVDNSYDSTYNLTNKNHELNILTELHGEDFPIDEIDLRSSAHYAKDFIYDLMDLQFLQDWKSVQDGYHVPGSTVRAYRIELVREGTNLRVYINGKLADTLDDGIVGTDENWNTIPGKVSWSYGPLLRVGGETVTCSIGALYIYGREPSEVTDGE